MKKISKYIYLYKFAELLILYVANYSSYRVISLLFKSNFITVLFLIGAVISTFRIIYEMIDQGVFFRWKDNNSDLYIFHGILRKTELHIYFESIIGVTISSPWYMKLVKLSIITIHVPENGEKSRVVIPLVTMRDLKIFQTIQKSTSIKKISTTNVIKPFKFINLLKSSLLSGQYLYFFTIIGLIDHLLKFLGNKYEISNYILLGIQSNYRYYYIAIIVTGMLFSSILKQTLDYFNLRFTDNLYEIVISNGILSTQEEKINKKEIQGILIRRSLGEKILKLASVELLSKKSHSGSKIKTRVLFPFTTQRFVLSELKKYFSDWKLPQLKDNFTLLFVSMLLNLMIIIIFFCIQKMILFSVILWILIVLIFFIFNIFMILLSVKYENLGNYITIEYGIYSTTVMVLKSDTLEWINQRHVGVLSINTLAIKMSRLKKFCFIGLKEIKNDIDI